MISINIPTPINKPIAENDFLTPAEITSITVFGAGSSPSLTSCGSPFAFANGSFLPTKKLIIVAVANIATMPNTPKNFGKTISPTIKRISTNTGMQTVQLSSFKIFVSTTLSIWSSAIGLTYFLPSKITETIASGSANTSNGNVKSTYGMSTTSQITIAGTLIGGATIPKIEPVATIAPAFAFGIPHLIIIGAKSAPDAIADANDEPVTIAGNMIISMKQINKSVGYFLNFLTSAALMYSSAPDDCIAPMNIIATVITRIVSK